MLGPWERVAAGAEDVLARAGGRPGHIFNLGHGVLPESDPAEGSAGIGNGARATATEAEGIVWLSGDPAPRAVGSGGPRPERFLG